ncbi:MAG: rod shape-determining protein MreC [Clostridiales Family XIII bacterium]|jgi:rod shape-determining protein MreC|nr:rod shape-determining protein MreC [Clostridiales Family XIII bacterium]
MRWFARHRFLTIIAAVLAALVVLFAVSVNLQGDDTLAGKAARSFVTFAQKPFISLKDKILGNDAEAGVRSRDEIDKLQSEIEELKLELQMSKLTAEEYAELKTLSEGLNMVDPSVAIKPVAADVISYSNTDTFNIFTVDVGSEEGVVRDSVVICGNGLVGRVISSDKGWARVVSITDENNRIGFQVAEQKDGRNVSFLGICSGDGEGNMKGNLLDEEGFAKEGDEVITSGLGGIYPAGLTIGKVTKAGYTKKSQLLEVTIEPAAYFKGLKKVVILI